MSGSVKWAPTRFATPTGEYVRGQVWATFQDDPTSPATYQLFGEDNYMRASAFPLSDSTFTHSREYIEKNFTGVLGVCDEDDVFERCQPLSDGSWLSPSASV